MTFLDEALRKRFLIASVLLLLCTILFLLYMRSGTEHLSEERLNQIDRAIDSVLARNRIGPRNVRKWQVSVPGGGRPRVERRVTVPGEFVSVGFNKELSDALAPLAAR